MSYTLNYFTGGCIGSRKGTDIGVIKGDTRGLDCSSYRGFLKLGEHKTTHTFLFYVKI